MKLCSAHIEAVQKAVEELGLHLLEHTNQDASLLGTTTAELVKSGYTGMYSPYIITLRDLYESAIYVYGVHSLQKDPATNALKCPLCIVYHNPCNCGDADCGCRTPELAEAYWINTAVGAAYKYAVELGLIKHQ